jgi:hypothetical protein
MYEPGRVFASLEVTPMTISRQTDSDDTSLRIPRTWLEQHAPAELECVCPESCPLDHDN